MTFEDIVNQFFYQEFPTAGGDPKVRFEAVTASVIGTKQRRYGPMPTPEVQVAVRDVIRASDNRIHFFTPWGARKQTDGLALDVLEFMALKQLHCLRQELERYGVESVFHFRVDDLMDRYLFGDDSIDQINTYTATFDKLANEVLSGSGVVINRESFLTTWQTFQGYAKEAAPVVYDYLKSGDPVYLNRLHGLGWRGDINQVQRDYYLKAYQTLYPDKDHNWMLAKYFGATLARARTLSAAYPRDKYVVINFHQSIPGSPVEGSRLYYRTLPAKYTHAHRAPWMGKGYLVVDEKNGVAPRILQPGEAPRFDAHTVMVNGVPVGADYLVECDHALIG